MSASIEVQDIDMGWLAIKKELKKYTNPEKAKILQRFFKTGKGE